MIALRVSRCYDELKTFFDRPELNSAIVFQHDADEDVSRTHVHALIPDKKVSIDTLKRWIKSDLGVDEFSRYDWSFKNGADMDFITYMSKGKLKSVQNKVYTNVEDRYRSKWVDHGRPARSEKKDTEITVYDLAKELADWIDLDKSDRVYKDIATGQLIATTIDDRDVVLKAIELHKKYRKTFCDFSLVRVIQTAYGICVKDGFRDKLVAKVLEKLSPYNT